MRARHTAARRMLATLPRCPLATLPTPVEELRGLGASLGGRRLLIKRDDLTGLALGGNKARKLEYLVADARAHGADVLLTAGAAQSNHCRQTAAAAARSGLRCELVLGGQPPALTTGNLLLDTLFGATIHWTGMERRGERLEEVADGLRASGKAPYVVPYGGSNAVGATGYVAAMAELVDQLHQARLTVDHIVVASSSGGTQAGLVAGAALTGFTGVIHGISIDKGERTGDDYPAELAGLANATAGRLGLSHRFTPQDFVVHTGYLGGGYGVVGGLERQAIHRVAREEGILLDPVYTGRAFGALLDMIERKIFSVSETVLFWHTGGAPALFAYATELM